MRLLDLTLPTAAENLALDEALLEQAEAGNGPREVLRLWEPRELLVVVGRSSQSDAETRREACARQQVPILRRVSGGAAIVTGPGCLMYAVVLSLASRPALQAIDAAHRFVLARLVEALGRLAPGVTCCGTSDLAVPLPRDAAPDAASADTPSEPNSLVLRKFSGNSLRLKRRHLLYHGTLLYDFDLARVEELLVHPPREPAYRQGRRHAEFVANLPVTREAMRQALVAAWGASLPLTEWPRTRTAQLAADKYSTEAWNRHGRS